MDDFSKFLLSLKRAAWRGFWDGRNADAYFYSCRKINRDMGVLAVFTRDVGYHSSGWWKNPDYERCFHLSLSFFDRETADPTPRNKAVTDRILSALFGRDKEKLWAEPPYSAEGKRKDVWHYRLFCDKGWNAIVPRGEVYSRWDTEANWLSWSDLQALIAAEASGGTVLAVPEPNRNEVSR